MQSQDQKTGCWVSSKGQLTETLYYARQEAIRAQYNYTEDELLKVYYALTPTFTATVQSLNKPIIIVMDEYVMGGEVDIREMNENII